nr:MAG TPA: hypothetical protein [Caudoviricetes sp.]
MIFCVSHLFDLLVFRKPEHILFSNLIYNISG